MNTFQKIFSEIQIDLENNAEEEFREKIRDYFKMDVSNYMGVRLPVVRKIAKKHFRNIKDLDVDQVLKICDELLTTRIYEHKVIAFEWSFNCKKQFQKKHFEIFERWLKIYVDDWSDCDDLCTHSFGYFLHKFPEFSNKVKKWSLSKNRWQRRASAVIWIYSVRKGEHLNDVLEVASTLFTDEDDLVQKGYGWMLKEASKNYKDEVFEFVLDNRARMPRTALRYAIEKMPTNYKKAAMSN